jgi:aspartyl-tRNA(Asn)/glutamyl-tRNA(Gln) amidotransferase subunit A
LSLIGSTAHVLQERLERGEVTAEELTRAYLERIAAVEARVKGFITVTPEAALTQARMVDEARRRGERLSPMAGIPVAVKDNFCTKGVPTTCGSRILEGFVPPFQGTVAGRLADAGAVILGKTNMDEFAMGSSTENSAFFPTRNPWDLDRVPGGSSGGSAAAVAAGEAVIGFGSDTGGSVRQPASFCGVVGLKPTYGLVSRFGLVAFASSLDQIGPLALDVTDAALALQVIAGHDPLDSTSARYHSPDYRAGIDRGVKGLRIGVPKEYFGPGTEPAVESAVREAIDRLVTLGAEAEECSLPHTDHALAAYYIIAPAECSANLARYDGVRYGLRAAGAETLGEMYAKTRAQGFGAEVERRIMLGTYALSSGYYDAYYLKAQKVRTLVRRDFQRAFEKYDLLAAPTSPTVAFKQGEKTDDPLAMYLADVCTIPVNLAGLPGLSLPCGEAGGLPIGLQLIGQPLDEATLFHAAYAHEQASGFKPRVAPLAGTGGSAGLDAAERTGQAVAERTGKRGERA